MTLRIFAENHLIFRNAYSAFDTSAFTFWRSELAGCCSAAPYRRGNGPEKRNSNSPLFGWFENITRKVLRRILLTGTGQRV
jgi:hypothetical protein